MKIYTIKEKGNMTDKCKQFVRKEVDEWLNNQPDNINFSISPFEDTFVIRRKN